MIDVTHPAIFNAAVTQLSAYRTATPHVRGRLVQIFLALKLYQQQLPSMFSGQFVATRVLQGMLDDAYAKSSLPAHACVLMVFEGTYRARTGITAPGNTTPQNTWRNNLNLQKGIGCYAPTNDLASPTFQAQPRVQCRHLVPLGGPLSGARCGLAQGGASYRNEDHPKWLRIDPGGNGYAITDLMQVTNFAGYVAPGGRRIPLLPLIAAVYHDALPGTRTGSRRRVTVSDFAADFGLSAAEMSAYFDDSAMNPYNSALTAAFPGAQLGGVPAAAGPGAAPFTGAGAPGTAAAAPLPQPILQGTQTAPPAVNNGWDAEQFVMTALRALGWTVYDVSRQKLGYDLLAKKGQQTRYIDVKSSVGYCSPTLTTREWQQAQLQGANYLLAVVEMFNPTGTNTIYWVRDPARCPANPYSTTEYAIARGAWIGSTVPATRI